MRKITDKLKISRAKLAFLVDSTAAPIACIALITTWVGFQLGMIDASIKQIDAITESAYLIYLNSIAYSFLSHLHVGICHDNCWVRQGLCSYVQI